MVIIFCVLFKYVKNAFVVNLKMIVFVWRYKMITVH